MSDVEDKKVEAESVDAAEVEAVEEELACVWNMGTPCDGETDRKLMFHQQLKVPICHKHFEEHKEVMILHHQGYDIEEIVDMEADERKRLVYTMILAELDMSKVEI